MDGDGHLHRSIVGRIASGNRVTWIGIGVDKFAERKFVQQWGIDDALGLMQIDGNIPSGGGNGNAS